MATFSAHPPDLELLRLLLRWIRYGERLDWIYEASVYADDPVAMSTQYSPATADDGQRAWYFVCAPPKKEGNDDRKSRLAGAGTWKEERGRALSIAKDGGHKEVGWRQSFSYIVKTKGQRDSRSGWLMVEIQMVGDEKCLYKVYPSPRPLASRWVPALENLARAPRLIATTATQAEATATAATGRVPPAPAAAATTTGSTTSPTGAETTSGRAPPAPPEAGRVAPAPPAPSAAATTGSTGGAQAATTSPIEPEEATPPRKWIKIQISDSPTKCSDNSCAKRVFQVVDLPEEEDVCNKRRRLNCRGWFMVDAMPSQEIH